MALAPLDHEVAAVVLANAAGNSAAKIAVVQPAEDDLADPVERLAELRTAGLTGMDMG